MSQTPKKDTYTAALIIIGNEILSGRTQDTNTPWIAERLTGQGILLLEVRVIPDVEAQIVGAVNELRAKYDHVFTTGGIGPTHDDITSASIARAFGVPYEMNDEAFQALQQHYGIDKLTPPRAKMAMIPVGAVLIPNPVTVAPGFRLENVYVMAGVPRIMQAMFDFVLDSIDAGKPILSETIACTLTESAVAEDLTALQNKYPDVQIGSYPHYRGGVLGLSLVIRTIDPASLEKCNKELLDLIRRHGDAPRALTMKLHKEV